MSNIFEKDLNGETISFDDPEIKKITNIINNTQKITNKINRKSLSNKSKNKFFSKLINKKVPESFWYLTPIHIDYGRNITLGENVFINFGCTLLDRGGITIGDNVLIGPNCSFYTTNHPLDPNERQATISKPIIIKSDVWFGGNVTVIPGITINKNSIIAAGSVVTKDVPEGVIVAGNPAKIIRKIKTA